MSDNQASNQTQETTNNEAVDDTITVNKAELAKLIREESNKVVHAALASKNKKTTPKVAPVVAADETAEVVAEGTSPDVTALMTTIKKQNERLLAAEKKLKAADEAVKTSNLKSTVSTLAKGKLAEGWEDLAEEKFLALVNFDEDDKPSVVVDDLSYGLKDGFEAWLNHDSNKRFRKAQKAMPATRASTTANRPLVSPVNAGKDVNFNDQIDSVAEALRLSGISLVK